MNARSVLRVAAVVVAATGCLKLAAMLVDTGFDVDPTQVPWGYIALFIVPFFVVLALDPRRPRTAARVMAVFSAATFLFMAVGVVGSGFVLEGWGDYAAGYVGGSAALIGLVASARVLADRHAVAAH